MCWKEERERYPSPISAWSAIAEMRQQGASPDNFVSREQFDKVVDRIKSIDADRKRLIKETNKLRAKLAKSENMEEMLMGDIKTLDGFVSELQQRLRDSEKAATK